ncbi:MAG: PIN domain-containing protein [Thermoflexales bacterium]|nr:PIN domain-containing protein [Thermoflexales bacterium]
MSESVKAIYLDACALCRPFDDQTQMRVRLETDAVQLVLSHVRAGELTMVISPAHDAEIGAIDDDTEREDLLSTMQRIGQRPMFDLKQARERAEELVRLGFGLADAAHLAFAEASQADFITCDDRLIRQCRHIQLSVWCGTPVSFCDRENF